jgi:hypothetical protein
VLRSLFRNRAKRQLRETAIADLAGLRDDARWTSFISPAASGIASTDVEGYLAAGDVKPLEQDFLLMPADSEVNVIIHVLSRGQKAYPGSKLLLAAALAEHRGPREELRAAELLCEVAEERQGAKR